MSNGEQTDTGRSYSGRCPIHNVRTYIHIKPGRVRLTFQ